MKLKEAYQMTTEEKQKAEELNNIFTATKNENDMHTYLDPTPGFKKALPKKIEKEIDDLYYKYLYPLQNIDWYNPYELELDDLKKDNFCGKNNNKKYWVKAYMLNWLSDLPIQPTAEWLFAHITSRESYQRIIKNVYDY